MREQASPQSKYLDRQTFKLLTDHQSIMAIGRSFMTSKVMEQKPVADWKTGWDIATILEALKEYYPLATSDNFVSSYEKWYLLYKSMRSSIGLLRKLYSEHLITSFSDIGDMPVEHEVTLLSKFSKVFTNFHYPHKDWGSNKSFQTDLSDTLDKD